MHIKATNILTISTVFAVLVARSPAKADHCSDKMRTLIMDSCKAISLAHRQQLSPWSTTETPIVKRENEVEPEVNMEFISDETELDYPRSHRMYYVRRKSFPRGAHLIMSQRYAKMLRDFDPEYKIHVQPFHYESKGGVMERVVSRAKRTVHHKRKRDIHHKISMCCENDVSCMAALCFA